MAHPHTRHRPCAWRRHAGRRCGEAAISEQIPADALRVATLDLRPLEPVRGGSEARAAAPVLQRANLKLTVLLPVGSEPGNYEFEVRDQQDSTQIRGADVAKIRNYITTIETTVDLRKLIPGRSNGLSVVLERPIGVIIRLRSVE